MVIPAAMFIESAVDALDAVSQEVDMDEAKELRCAMGADKAEKLGIDFPINQQFILGYQIGLQTARIMMATSIALLKAGVNPEEVL